MPRRVVLAYSGGLDTSVAVRWMREEWDVEVVACAVDVGQLVAGEEETIRERAEAAGAVEIEIIDARHEYANGFLAPALAANAMYEGKYPLVSALSRPVITEHLVACARRHRADAVAHGCTGKGNDQVRFEVSSRVLAPDLDVLAPVRVWGLTRADCIELAAKWDIPISASKEKLYSIDENMWGRAIECGVLENPWSLPPEEPFTITRSPKEAPAEPRMIVVGFERGVPVSFDGESLDLVEIIGRLGDAVGSYGWGRIDMVENRRVGIKSREVYECPASLALILAHRDLEGITLERDVAREKQRVEIRVAELIYDGLWHSPLMRALDAFVQSTQEHVTGEVRLRLEAGRCDAIGRRAPRSLYDHDLATYDAEDSFRHADSEGFVRLWGLSAETWSRSAGAGRIVTDTKPDRGADGGNARPLWHGRFGEEPSDELLAFTVSLPFDVRLASDDLAGSRAHVHMLERVGLLTSDERSVVQVALDRVEQELESGSFAFAPTDEDIHTAIERRVTEIAGPAGAKLHTGRSRNDQIALDMRLFLRREGRAQVRRIHALQGVLLQRAEDSNEVALPGYTHLQRAQPVLLAHHLLADFWAFARDVDRWRDCMARANVSPLGAGALAGSSLPLDPASVAHDLEFARPFENSLDAVGDRDFVAEALFVAALVQVHLSRIGEEIVLWSTEEFGFVQLSDVFATGSSMLPQKKNPDIAELARGKAGRLIGDLAGFLATLKGLPLAYNRDLQEDKEPLFDALDTCALSLSAITGLMSTATFVDTTMTAAADSPVNAATDLAEHLVDRGTPFREAHTIVGALVRQSVERGVPLDELVLNDPRLGPDCLPLLEPGSAVRRRTTPGGGGPDAVARQMQTAKERLERQQAWLEH